MSADRWPSSLRSLPVFAALIAAATLGAHAADTTPPGDVAKATAAARDSVVTLEWDNPTDADFAGVLVLRHAGSAVPDAPVDGQSYSVGDTIGSSDVVCVTTSSETSCDDTGVTNGVEYHYKLCAFDGTLNYAGGVSTTGLPRALPYKWAFTTRAATLAPVGAIPSAYIVSVGNDRLLYRMAESDGRRAGWSPPEVSGAVQARPMVGDLNPAVPGSPDYTGFVSSQDGNLYRFDMSADSTAEGVAHVAQDAGCPSGALQAPAVVMLDAFDNNPNPDDDVVVVATRCPDSNGDGTANDNKIMLYSHDLSTLYDTYDGDWDGTGSADSPGLGVSNAAPRILYRDDTNNFVYVPFNPDGDDDESIVAIEVLAANGSHTGPRFDIPVFSETRGLGSVDTDLVLFTFGYGNNHYLLFGASDGTGQGTLYLYDALTRTAGPGSPLKQRGSIPSTDGPVKGVAVSTPVPLGNGFYEHWVVWSTDNQVHGVRIKPGTIRFDSSSRWDLTLPDDTDPATGPSAPIVLRWVGGTENTRAYVGASDGVLYELDAKTGAIVRTWSVESGATLGSPTFDYNDGVHQGIVIGSTAGRVHWVSLD
ncbi:MAG: hypothetical protein D6718_09975 [Acidobacteria bacterium]|nr:MAG: hypothetical protein D6718_09975 [Acidobacteriota bacterium]